MTRRHLLASLLALLAAGLAWRAWSDRDAAAPPPAPTAAVQAPVAAPGPRAERAGPPVAPYDPTRPPRPVEPVPDIATLVARADGGDARAACQVAAEIAQCEQANLGAKLSAASVAQMETAAADWPDAARREATIAGLRARLRCQTWLREHAGRRFAYLRQAAFAGEPEAMLRYGSGEGFGAVNGSSFAYLASPDFDSWRREAPGMMQSLFEAGYPEAALTLAFAQDPMLGGHLAALFPRDPRLERARIELLLLFAGDRLDPAALGALRGREAGEDGAQAREARALARRWHLDYFGGRSLPETPDDSDDRYPYLRASGQACSQPIEGLKP